MNDFAEMVSSIVNVEGGEVLELLLIDTMVFHEVIASFHKDIPTLSTLISSQNLKRELEDSWRYIIQKNQL
ncbi:MAG: hypothetical protein QXL22_06680 [Candidatus Nezhaarchaeales archaeon]